MYLRYNAELSWDWPVKRGLASVNRRHVQQMDSTSHVAELQFVARAVAAEVDRSHFQGFV
jgi:hypothetical protein